MSTTTILPNIKIEDVPQNAAQVIEGIGTIGDVELKPVANGYTRVTVPLTYTKSNGSDGTFYANWNVREEWFTPAFVERYKAGELQGTEALQYQINMSGLTRGLFTAVGLADTDFTKLTGLRVGFKTKTRKNDPSKLDVSRFTKLPTS